MTRNLDRTVAPPKPARRTIHFPITAVLVAGFGGLVLLAAAGVLFLSLSIATKNTFDLLAENAHSRVDVIERHITNQISASRQMAIDVAALISRGELDPNDLNQMRSIFRGALVGVRGAAGIAYLRADMQVFAMRNDQDPASAYYADARNDPLFNKAMARIETSVEPFWQKIVWIPQLSAPALSVHVPVRDGGGFKGGIIVPVLLDTVTGVVADLSESAESPAFILYGPDHILAHPDVHNADWDPDLQSNAVPLPLRAEANDPVLSQVPREELVNILESTDRETLVHPVPKDDPDYILVWRKIAGFSDKPWIIGQRFRTDDVDETIDRLFGALFAGLVILVIAVLLAVWIARRLSRRISELADAATKLRTLDFAAAPTLRDSRLRELSNAASAFNSMVAALRWFEMYLPKSLVLRLMQGSGDDHPVSERRVVTVLFTDIRGFSALAQEMDATEIAEVLNHHFTLLAGCIHDEGGTVDKYIGDSIMAFWGAPDDQPDHAARAVRAAIAIQRVLAEDNRRRREAGMVPIRIRAGINTGDVIVGNIGSENRINYTLVGDSVNTAERLERMAASVVSDDDAAILISDGTAQMAGMDEWLEPLGQHILRGRSRRVGVYRLRAPTRTVKASLASEP